MAVFRSFTFDDINSMDYGVYISGDEVYNAPARVVEMVEIPGKNGALAIDQGRFENIEVTYPAGVYASSQEEFAEKVRTFRNILCSRFSYKKIVDEYHPDEYRLGLYKSGLEVSPAVYSSAGQFDITFECKPQRFLTIGDEPLDLYDHDVLTDHNLEALTDHNGNEFDVDSMSGSFTNPTDFESHPLIIAPSSGSVVIGNQTITIGGDSSTPIYIDCDSMEIYTKNASGAVTNASELVNFVPNEIPSIKPGENTLRSSIEDVQIIPRWWIL